MPEVEITSITLVAEPRRGKHGNTLLAHFDCEARGFAFTNCALAASKHGRPVVWMARIGGSGRLLRAVTVKDDALRREIFDRALEAYNQAAAEETASLFLTSTARRTAAIAATAAAALTKTRVLERGTRAGGAGKFHR